MDPLDLTRVNIVIQVTKNSAEPLAKEINDYIVQNGKIHFKDIYNLAKEKHHLRLNPYNFKIDILSEDEIIHYGWDDIINIQIENKYDNWYLTLPNAKYLKED